MKKIYLYTIVIMISSSIHLKAQILCIKCFDQNAAISTGVNNLIVNGGFENTNCNPISLGGFNSICPNSHYVLCNIANWICTGGGYDTYADIDTGFVSNVVEGTNTVYFGNGGCLICSSDAGDSSCINKIGCYTTGIPSGYPYNTVDYGGATGVSLEQTVTGLIPGNNYVLEFWAGGEKDSPFFPYNVKGLFAVDIGFGKTFLRCKPTAPNTGIGTRYIIEFTADSVSHTFKFTNWGHFRYSTELVLDDVRLYTMAELSPAVPPCCELYPTITNNGNTINLNTTYSSYQWYFNDSVISGATNQTYTISQSGNYFVEVTDSVAGCSAISNILELTFNGIHTPEITKFNIYPNPANEDIIIAVNSTGNENYLLRLQNTIGQTLIEKQFSTNKGNNKIPLSLVHLSKDVYLLQFISSQNIFISRIIKN